MNSNNFTILDKDFENKLVSLKQRLKSRMNGKTTEQMSNGQINYAINYGASLAHIKELAAEFDYTNDDCRKLFKTNIREAMLIATICLTDDAATPEELVSWISVIQTPDMAEQASFFLFYRCTDINELCNTLLENENKYSLSIASFSAGRAIQTNRQIANSTVMALTEAISKRNPTASDARGISLFMRQALRIEGQKELITSIAKNWQTSNDNIKRQISFEVNNEL